MMKKTAAVLAAVLVVVSCSLCAFALLTLPQADGGARFYVSDNAGLFSDAAEADFCKSSAALEDISGAQLVLVTVDFLGAEKIDDYAKRLFEAWQIGTPQEDTGCLLLLCSGEESYYIVLGGGFEGYISRNELSELLDEQLEADFAAGEYETGAKKTLEALVVKLSQACNKKHDDTALEEAEKAATLADNARRFRNKVLISVGSLVFVIAIAAAVILKIRSDNLRRKRARQQRRKSGGSSAAIDYAGRGRETDNSDKLF